MPNDAAATLIATSLAHLTHPGDGKPVVLPLPMFRSSGIPADQADQFAQDAGLPHADIGKLVAEAVINLLETNGYQIVGDNDLAQLNAAAAANEHQRHRDMQIDCRSCGTELFKVIAEDYQTDRVKIAPQVIRAVQSLSPECALGHQVVA